MSAPALENGLKIIELVLQTNDHGIGFNQLKQKLDTNAASLNRYLKVLLEWEFIGKNDHQLYIPGPKWQSALFQARRLQDEQHLSASVLENISSRSGFTAVWIDYRDGRMYCRDKHRAPEGLEMQSPGELRTDYTIQPWGHIWLSELDPTLRAFLIEHTNLGSYPFSPPDNTLMEQLLSEAACGRADDYGYMYDGQIRRLAVGIRAQGKLCSAIAVGLPGRQWPESTITQTMELLTQQAQRIEQLWAAQ